MMKGGEAGWNAARLQITKRGMLVTRVSEVEGKGFVVNGVMKDGASVEIRNFSRGKGQDLFTIKISEFGSHIQHMYRWRKK